MIVIGLTGSIGMGKTTTAGLFADEGARVFDADAAVHALYAPQGAGVAPLTKVFGEGVLDADGGIDRGALASIIQTQAGALAQIEAIIHPMVRQARQDFVNAQRRAGTQVVVLDVPLLLETGAEGEGEVDVVVVASASEAVQRARVLARPGMTMERLATILSKQMPDADKRAKADFIVETGEGIAHARGQVRKILAAVVAGAGSGDNLGEGSDHGAI